MISQIKLSATLGYSIAQELDEDDLAIFLVFLELLVIEMQLIVTQRAIEDTALIIIKALGCEK